MPVPDAEAAPELVFTFRGTRPPASDSTVIVTSQVPPRWWCGKHSAFRPGIVRRTPFLGLCQGIQLGSVVEGW